MTPTLIAYATTYGSTREMVDAVAATLAASGFDAVVRAAREVESLDEYAAAIVMPNQYGWWGHALS